MQQQQPLHHEDDGFVLPSNRKQRRWQKGSTSSSSSAAAAAARSLEDPGIDAAAAAIALRECRCSNPGFRRSLICLFAYPPSHPQCLDCVCVIIDASLCRRELRSWPWFLQAVHTIRAAAASSSSSSSPSPTPPVTSTLPRSPYICLRVYGLGSPCSSASSLIQVRRLRSHPHLRLHFPMHRRHGCHNPSSSHLPSNSLLNCP